jgi:methionyl-tRNA formyltransferase
MKKSGWSFAIKSILTTIWKAFEIKFGKWFVKNKRREHFDIDEMAKHYKIPFLKSHDINSPESKAFIRKLNPDYLVSCFLMQIVDKEILSIPKNGAINVHPALIQEHRGTFTSFWALLKDWQKSGATVHFMTEKPDNGIVIIQRHFFVHPSDTIYCVNKKSAQLGANLLVRALIKIKRDEAIGYIIKKFGHMFKMPTSKDVKRFYGRGKSIIKIRDFFKI